MFVIFPQYFLKMQIEYYNEAQHMTQQRRTQCDTLYDYAYSYSALPHIFICCFSAFLRICKLGMHFGGAR